MFRFIYVACLLISITSIAQKQMKLISPDANLVFNLQIKNGNAFYNIVYKGKTIVNNSKLGLDFWDGDFENNLHAGKPLYRKGVESYQLTVGKTSNVHDAYRQMTVPLVQSSTQRIVNLIVRAFNDGIAFCYQFPEQTKLHSFQIMEEKSTFNLGNPVVHALLLPNFTTSHEGYYTTTSLSNLTADTLMDMPVLFEMPDHIFLGITEAQLIDYAGMYLTKHNGVLVSRLSPLPNQTAIKVKASTPHKTPWRVLLISDRIGALIESNIITDLNEPCKINDASWLKPGKTTFPWWNGDVVPDTLNAPGNNFVTNQYYIDFCARNHIQYHSVVEYGLHQWYMDDGVNFQPGPHADVTTPVPGLDMKEICDYAKSVGVDIRVWVHFYALYPKLDTAFAVFEKWGIKGMMVDFMDRDDQEMVNMQTEILQKAAQHHLHIQFHGAYKPTGLNRTYPNEFTREGTLNYEADKWNPDGISPDHDIMMPFTRMLAGSTDYHLGGFRAVPKNKFITQYTRPLVLGTRCHMLAMYVVLENYLQMVCDYPAAYESEPGFEWIQQIPTTWDATKVLDAEVGKFIVIARQKNNDWYVGSITNHEARELTVPLNFLNEGIYTAEIYTDANDVNENPNHLNKLIRNVTRKDIIDIKLAGGGGFVIRFKKQ
jgi:alpha-glucosidase